MSHLHLNLAIDDQATALQWRAAIAHRLRVLADEVATTRGPLEVRDDWANLEDWPQVIDPYQGPRERWPVQGPRERWHFPPSEPYGGPPQPRDGGRF